MYTKEQVELTVRESSSKSEVCRKLSLPKNGTSFRKVSRWIDEYGLDISHFKTPAELAQDRRKYPVQIKICPVCKKEFQESIGHARERTTCSHSCSNTYFRSKTDNGQYKHGIHSKVDGKRFGTLYRKICFERFKQECFLCGWNECVAVHHIDGNHDNNDPANLIPLCPNHHQSIHTKEFGQKTEIEILQKMGIDVKG